ncbi:serine protease AprX [Anaerovirgula multivorans]|uniref:Serine protease AprX n=1 Tax=Anaerovirgula multivorans TaxID=312168 RepID=A0A238ZW86_9FIRM|nr:S8 family peptidase [Anaerovirgula multivorans]SNR87677.1 serine protease AprX [Anaerovirgula multivorans]
MIFHKVSWIRSHRHKFCPTLRTMALEWYRPVNYVPCFIQKYFRIFKQSFRKIPVIVETNELGKMNQSVESLATSIGCKIDRKLHTINAFSTKVNAKTLELLAQNNNVKKIWYDREVKTLLDVASPTVGSTPLWNNNITGKDVVVVVMDTGIYEHPDLSGRIIAFKDFVNQKSHPYDDNGHGTHVAGDIAANGSQSNGNYRGPAPEAQLIGVKVLNKIGSGSLSVVIEGLQWCIDNKESLSIRVINMSLGAETTMPYSEDPVCMAVANAWEAGIVVCAAAGNSGPQNNTINSPGIHPSVITVGALDDRNTVSLEDDSVADFSSRGPTIDGFEKPDIIAPGTDIISLRSPNSMLDKQNKQARIDEWYTSLSGTSMATPVCSGVIAQILQVNPSLTPDQVKELLIHTANPLEDVDANSQGAGIINVKNAIGLSKNSITIH